MKLLTKEIIAIIEVKTIKDTLNIPRFRPSSIVDISGFDNPPIAIKVIRTAT